MTGDGYDKMTNIRVHSCDVYILAAGINIFID